MGKTRNYAEDSCLFFNFLWSRGKGWDRATTEDLLDFEAEPAAWSPYPPQPMTANSGLRRNTRGLDRESPGW